ncbi:patatin-like phospholipase family protein [Blastococcus sp. TF02A-26]|uniref:patatin-like phospholipase family protein n=1 Tax=Blastococcus sp. TF02A-26 TaxID=2250577 RepID=UPI000DE977C2|nr:patatin-like phospholipase family protein [Blastococcus sp. TF02A-26]RBY85855.1 patatin-like phospholipase family protein [Blastococcus sp. TF02A-26]
MAGGSTTSRALVLGGGGIAGVAWEIGLLSGLAVQGVDVRSADLVVGTSAGSVVGALVRGGHDLEQLYATQLQPVPPDEPTVDVDLVALMTGIGAALAGAAGEQEARARVGELALHADTVPEADRRAAIASRIGEPAWPAERLVVTAVDTADGAFTTFDAGSGVPLLDAVTASCAVPGVWPPITVGGRRYMDGGMRSATNADLAVGCDRVLVVAPVEGFADSPLGPGLAAELDELRRGSAVHLVVADDLARAAFGANPLDPRTREPSARAGRAQADAVLAGVREFWA